MVTLLRGRRKKGKAGGGWGGVIWLLLRDGVSAKHLGCWNRNDESVKKLNSCIKASMC